MSYKLIDNSLNDIYKPVETVLINRGIKDSFIYEEGGNNGKD